MKDLSFYEQVGFLFPGSVLLLGLLVLFPELKAQFSAGGVSVGGLGLFVIVAYVLGQLLAEVMTIFVEPIFWAPFGGRPSEWLPKEVKKGKSRLLWAEGNRAVLDKLDKRLNIPVEVDQLARKEWQKKFGPLYRDAFSHDTGGRILAFNGMYGLSGGIAVALIVLAVLCWWRDIAHWDWWAAGLALLAIVFLIRMWRFGKAFVVEVYRVFTQLPDTPGRPATGEAPAKA